MVPLLILIFAVHVCLDRFGEIEGSFCQLAVLKDGNLENQAHTINIADYLEQQQRRRHQNLNIVTTRTSANKLRAQAMKAAANQFHFNSTFQQNTFHNNYYNNQQQAPPVSYSSRKPFQKHQKNGYHNSYNGGGGKAGNYGNNGFSVNGNAQHQNKDRFHWVRGKQQQQHQQQNEVEKMRLSPN